MGRISDIIPPIYYDKRNDLIRFVDCLDIEVKELEQKVRGITDLVNVDKCPEEKLPYLAALTNCPLMGNNPALWRRQIKNWPYLLKIKGTALSLELFLDSIDVDEHKIYTFFRDAEGNLVEDKPEGVPFQDATGLWHNIRTHFFDLDIIWEDGHYLSWPQWHKDFLRSMNIWLTKAKPFHAELRNLNLYLLRYSTQNLSVGTATIQSTHHVIDLLQGIAGSSLLDVVVGTGTFQTTHHDIAIVQGTHSATGLDIAVGAGIIQSGHHNIDMVQGTSSASELDISIGTGTFQTWTHEVKHIQATKAEADSVIAVGASVIQGAKHEVDIQQCTSGSAELDISVGIVAAQKISHDVKIQQATRGSTEGDISVGAGVIAGSVHSVSLNQPTLGQAQACVPVGIGILQSATHTISVGISTIAKSELFTGTALKHDISHSVGLKLSGTLAHGEVAIGVGITQGKQQGIALRQAKSGSANLALPFALVLSNQVVHIISAEMSTLSRAELFAGTATMQTVSHNVGIKKAEGSSTGSLSAGCAIACGIHMQIKMAA